MKSEHKRIRKVLESRNRTTKRKVSAAGRQMAYVQILEDLGIVTLF